MILDHKSGDVKQMPLIDIFFIWFSFDRFFHLIYLCHWKVISTKPLLTRKRPIQRSLNKKKPKRRSVLLYVLLGYLITSNESVLSSDIMETNGNNSWWYTTTKWCRIVIGLLKYHVDLRRNVCPFMDETPVQTQRELKHWTDRHLIRNVNSLVKVKVHFRFIL